jgi:hypothetical protein
MDFFSGAVVGSANYFVWQDAQRPFLGVFGRLPSGGKSKNCGVLFIARTQGPGAVVMHQIVRKRPFLPSGVIALGTAAAAAAKAAAGGLWQPGGRAVAARRTRRARDTVVGRPAPHARWSLVGHCAPQCFPSAPDQVRGGFVGHSMIRGILAMPLLILFQKPTT